MNVLDLDKYLLIDILLFLTDGELFILIETCIDLYTIVMENNYLKTKKKNTWYIPSSQKYQVFTLG